MNPTVVLIRKLKSTPRKRHKDQKWAEIGSFLSMTQKQEKDEEKGLVFCTEG